MAVRLTERDLRLIRDVSLSHVLSRDQILALAYFGSIQRANARLQALREAKYLKVIPTPFYAQHLYGAGPDASSVVGEKIAALLSGRRPSPQFLQHALTVTNTRISLLAEGFERWRFEAQLLHCFSWGGRTWELRPDGMVWQGETPTLVEVDLGHVSPEKFALKLRSFEAFVASGEAMNSWGVASVHVLTLTTGRLRRSRLERLIRPTLGLRVSMATFDDKGIASPGGWK